MAGSRDLTNLNTELGIKTGSRTLLLVVSESLLVVLQAIAVNSTQASQVMETAFRQ